MKPLSRTLAGGLIVFIRAYQLLWSSWAPPVCRFQPSCSRYAVEALRRFGPWRGSWLAVRRIGRCHPWGGCGHDPVPELVPERSETNSPTDG